MSLIVYKTGQVGETCSVCGIDLHYRLRMEYNRELYCIVHDPDVESLARPGHSIKDEPQHEIYVSYGREYCKTCGGFVDVVPRIRELHDRLGLLDRESRDLFNYKPFPSDYDYKPRNVFRSGRDLSRRGKYESFMLPEAIKKHEKITIKVLPKAFQKMRYYIDACPKTETSGLFSVLKRRSDLYVVTDVFLINNHASGGYTDMDKPAIVQFMGTKAFASGHIKGWWHSHCNFGTFWSGTDTATVERFGGDSVGDTKPPFWVSIVGNLSHTFRGRVDTYAPWTALNDDISIPFNAPDDEALRIRCYKESREKVRPYKWGRGKVKISEFDEKDLKNMGVLDGNKGLYQARGDFAAQRGDVLQYNGDRRRVGW